MFRYFLILLLVLNFIGCSKNNPVELSNCDNQIEINEYASYSAIVNKIYANSSQPIVIFEKTQNNSTLVKVDSPDFDEAIVENFNQNNSQSSQLIQKFDIAQPYKFVTEKDFAEINSDYLKRYDKFQRKFPEAVSSTSQRMIFLSKAGFNKDLSQSVVYVQVWNDRRSLFFLQRENCKWQVVKENFIGIH